MNSIDIPAQIIEVEEIPRSMNTVKRTKKVKSPRSRKKHKEIESIHTKLYNKKNENSKASKQISVNEMQKRFWENKRIKHLEGFFTNLRHGGVTHKNKSVSLDKQPICNRKGGYINVSKASRRLHSYDKTQDYFEMN